MRNALGDLLFTEGRTQNGWKPDPVDDEVLQDLYNLVKFGPTSANCSPGRFIFLRTTEAKQRLRPAMSAGNLEKTMAAPVVVIVGYDPEFYEKLPQLFPHADARSWFTANAALSEETAFRNSTLQGAYIILAARMLGLGTGPMSGFDKAIVDELFFGQTRFKTNFLINLGYGEATKVFPRLPRLDFGEACTLL